MKLSSITVFCGSSIGNDPVYRQAALELGEYLARANLRLVYGGASVGLMGLLADSALEAGGEVYGVIPKSMIDIEIAHSGLTKLYTVSTMHERKAQMVELADGFILMPGGSGSLDEFFEVFTWQQLNYHQKPCAILNINGYYDLLIDFLENTVNNGFMREANYKNILIAQSSEALITKMEAFKLKPVKKWITEDL